MSTRLTSSNLFSPLRNPESLIRRRNFGKPSSLFDFEETISIPHNNQGPPPASPPTQNNNGPPSVVRPDGPAPDLRSIKELCQPSINGRGRPIASIPIQATDFRLRHHMIQQVQNYFQFYELRSDDANRHIDKFLEVTQHMNQNGVSDDTLRLSLFPYSLMHHATAWYDRLLRNSIQSFNDMMRKFHSKYFPPLMIDTFYNGLTLRHRDTINAAAGGTFMKKRPEECCDLIKNMTAHHNHWDTLATRDETSRTISSTTTTTEIDYDVGPWVYLILERPFLRTTRELIDVHGEKLTLQVNDEAITFKVGHTSRYSCNYHYESVNQINVINVACEEYAQEMLRFSDSSMSGNPTLSDPIITSSSPSFILFEGGDFILEEI
uniref:Reverse transcriptase domain-containing protein n=1 Tax=Tanacetum cinerariifolium TaxID=118510 RepID=A0A6L2JDF7_TANCI|nr:reverse transcriptase domain-containing protein [Tanacetum cinerariifolium]